MSEIRLKSTGTIKLFENDNTSNVTIASPASLTTDRTITLPDGDVTLVAGTMATGGVALATSTDNQVVTVTGADAITGETNLIYDGTILGCGATGASADLGVGIHVRTSDTGGSAEINADELVLENDDNCGITILSGNDDAGVINFGDDGDNNIGLISYTHDGNYMKFKTNNTEAMRIDSTGAVTKPLQPAFCATMSAGNTVSTTSATAIPFDTERFDQNADFNTGTYTFTAPVTGRYQLNLGALFKDATSGNIFMAIYSSNQTYEWVNEGGGTFEHVTITALADMDSGDTAVAKTSTASDSSYTQYAGTYSYFSGFLAC